LKKRKAEGRLVNIDESYLRKLITLPDKKTFIWNAIKEIAE